MTKEQTKETPEVVVDAAKKEEKKEREVDTIKLFTTYSFRLQIKRYGTGESNK